MENMPSSKIQQLNFFQFQNIQKEDVISKRIDFRNLKQIDPDNISKDLEAIEIETAHVDSFVEQFESELESILEKHAPLTQKTVTCRPPKAWFNDEILKMKQSLRKAERVWRKYEEPNQLEIVKELRLKYHYAICNEKRSVLSEKVLSSKGDSKQLYKLVSELTGTKTENPLPSGESDSSLAEKCADFFLGKIEKIRESLKDYESYTPNNKECPAFDSFHHLTCDEVKKLINELKTKSCELDKLPTKKTKKSH